MFNSELNEEAANLYAAPLGRAVMATARLEGALRDLLIQLMGSDTAWAAVNGMPISQVVQTMGTLLKRTSAADSVPELATWIERSNRVFAIRNVLVHGQWFPTDFTDGAIVVRYKDRRPDLEGESFTIARLEEFGVYADALARAVFEFVEAHLLGPRSRAPGG